MAATATHNLVGSLDAANTIPARLETLGMPHGFFAALCGLDKVQFSRLMSGAKPLSNTQTIELNEMLSALESITQFFEALPLGWNDPETIRALLKNFGLLPEAAKQSLKNNLELLRGGLAALGDRNE